MTAPQPRYTAFEKDNTPRSTSAKLIYSIIGFAVLPTIPAMFGGMIGPAILMWLIGAAIGLIYFTPTFAALRNRHINTNAIVWLNVLTGWTFIGWVVAVVWAYKRPEINAVPQATEHHNPNIHHKVCPFCAEPVRMAAIKCRHCGSDLSSTGH